MTETADAAGPPAYPMPRTCPFALPEQYTRLREEEPLARVLLPTGREAWLATRYEDVRRLFTDANLSADRVHPGFPALLSGQQAIDRRGFLPWMDPPEHTTYRRMVISEFTVRKVELLRPAVTRTVQECLDRILAGPRPVDLVQELSLPVPSLTICELLGVPYEDREVFQSRARLMTDRNTSGPDRLNSLVELRAFLHGLVLRRQADPQEDLLSRLAVRYREAGVEDAEHLTGMALLILVAGHETTANMISLGTAYLIEHPELKDSLVKDPSLVPKAVEEMLRYFSISDHSTGRVALADIEVGDATIAAGEGVLLSNAAANRDARAFERPEEFDLFRESPSHVAFGYGIHQCLGQNLARLELDVVFTSLLARLPDLRLAAPLAELPFKNDTIMYGLHELPVTW
ncbi:cytochrome P450 [Streptomyces sp. NBC_00433]